MYKTEFEFCKTEKWRPYLRPLAVFKNGMFPQFPSPPHPSGSIDSKHSTGFSAAIQVIQIILIWLSCICGDLHVSWDPWQLSQSPSPPHLPHPTPQVQLIQSNPLAFLLPGWIQSLVLISSRHTISSQPGCSGI